MVCYHLLHYLLGVLHSICGCSKHGRRTVISQTHRLTVKLREGLGVEELDLLVGENIDLVQDPVELPAQCAVLLVEEGLV